ncbi:hypothetical protein HD554DRAFT_1670894 [Boletus coccyginus]|nr:hypothetical protein HD554DRAFT_1670894 [Boletus coccyginus]
MFMFPDSLRARGRKYRHQAVHSEVPCSLDALETLHMKRAQSSVIVGGFSAGGGCALGMFQIHARKLSCHYQRPRHSSDKPSRNLDARHRTTPRAAHSAYLPPHTRGSQQKYVRHIIFLRLRDEHDHHPHTPTTADSHLFVSPLAQSTFTEFALRSTAPCLPDEGVGRIGRDRESGSRSRVRLGLQTRSPALQIAQTLKVAKPVRKHASVGTGFRVWRHPWRGIVFHCAYGGRTRLLLWPR